jgi:hypothetical protein
VDETGSLAEASSACGTDSGDGIPRGSASLVTLHLDARRYELICNPPGHYAQGVHRARRLIQPSRIRCISSSLPGMHRTSYSQ